MIRILLFVSAFPFLFLACGGGEEYVPNMTGGEGRGQNFSHISLSTFSRFSENHYDSLGAGFLGPPLALASDKIAVVTTDRRLALMRYERILFTWQFPEGSYPLPELASDSLGTLYATTTEGNLYAVDTSGSMKWQASLHSPNDSNNYSLPLFPLTVPGGVVCGMTDGSLAEYDREGKELWRKTFGAGLVRPIAYREELGILLGLTQNDYDLQDTVVLLNLKGEEKWRFAIEGRIEYGPIIVEDRVVVGVAGREEEGKYTPSLLSIDANGTKEWEAPLTALPTGITSDGNGNTYVSGGGGSRISGGVVVSFDPEGAKRWEVGLQQSVPLSPLIAGDILCFLGVLDNSIGVFLYATDGTFQKFASVESTAKITLPPTVLPNGSYVIACSSEPILLKSNSGGLLGF
ncbi:MAG: PQQ-binding-like beta-propeller repeat protein [Candidatus Kapaibacterium sp.]